MAACLKALFQSEIIAPFRANRVTFAAANLWEESKLLFEHTHYYPAFRSQEMLADITINTYHVVYTLLIKC